MPSSAGERPVLLSVLDRLIDSEPGLRDDPSITRAQSIRELKASLQRDLEWLLNTRVNPLEHPESSEELKNSVFSYGLPEFRELNFSDAPEILSKYIETSIRRFEPRLASVRVTMRPGEGTLRIAHFIIDAVLLIDPMPERVTFDTVLELTRGEYRVGADRGA
jgi:type VI secretion system protein ImpF